MLSRHNAEGTQPAAHSLEAEQVKQRRLAADILALFVVRHRLYFYGPYVANYTSEHHLDTGALQSLDAHDSRLLPERGGDFRRQDETRSTSTLGYVLRTFFLVKASLVTARHGSINNDGVDAACYGHLIETRTGSGRPLLFRPYKEESDAFQYRTFERESHRRVRPCEAFGCSTCTQASACISDIDISEKERQND